MSKTGDDECLATIGQSSSVEGFKSTLLPAMYRVCEGVRCLRSDLSTSRRVGTTVEGAAMICVKRFREPSRRWLSLVWVVRRCSGKRYVRVARRLLVETATTLVAVSGEILAQSRLQGTRSRADVAESGRRRSMEGLHCLRSERKNWCEFVQHTMHNSRNNEQRFEQRGRSKGWDAAKHELETPKTQFSFRDAQCASIKLERQASQTETIQ